MYTSIFKSNILNLNFVNSLIFYLLKPITVQKKKKRGRARACVVRNTCSRQAHQLVRQNCLPYLFLLAETHQKSSRFGEVSASPIDKK